MDSTPPLTDLVNTTRIRSSIRRLFNNSISEVLSELFQNSQRARASMVRIETWDTGFCYSDNGHGLADLQAFHTLVRLADSHFDNPTIADQDPMGLGIHALLALTDVSSVTFHSGDLALTIDTWRWWSDPEYYQSWYERVETLLETQHGLRIVVELCEQSRLVAQLEAALGHTPANGVTIGYHTTLRPANGYDDLLTITFNGRPVETAVPFALYFAHGELLIDTTYQSCALRVYYAPDQMYTRARSLVNWYGQVIETPALWSFRYYLHVRAGRPVNPKSPTRSGLIQDAALTRLHETIRAELRAFFHDPANYERIAAKPGMVNAYFSYDPDGAKALPYCVVKPCLYPDSITSVEDLELEAEPYVCRYEDLPLVLNDTLVVDHPQDGPSKHDYGLTSFIPLLPDGVGKVIYGDERRYQGGTLWWQPGPERSDGFYGPGVWGISYDDTAPKAWHPVTRTVYAFTVPSHWDVNDVDWTVGTTDPISFYRDEAWAGFDSDTSDLDSSYSEVERAYRNSCLEQIRVLDGNAVSQYATLHELAQRLPSRTSRIVALEWEYAHPTSFNPVAITVRNAAGETATFRVID